MILHGTGAFVIVVVVVVICVAGRLEIVAARSGAAAAERIPASRGGGRAIALFYRTSARFGWSSRCIIACIGIVRAGCSGGNGSGFGFDINLARVDRRMTGHSSEERGESGHDAMAPVVIFHWTSSLFRRR